MKNRTVVRNTFHNFLSLIDEMFKTDLRRRLNVPRAEGKVPASVFLLRLKKAFFLSGNRQVNRVNKHSQNKSSRGCVSLVMKLTLDLHRLDNDPNSLGMGPTSQFSPNKRRSKNKEAKKKGNNRYKR